MTGVPAGSAENIAGERCICAAAPSNNLRQPQENSRPVAANLD
jgi:hypothetical protein